MKPVMQPLASRAGAADDVSLLEPLADDPADDPADDAADDAADDVADKLTDDDTAEEPVAEPLPVDATAVAADGAAPAFDPPVTAAPTLLAPAVDELSAEVLLEHPASSRAATSGIVTTADRRALGGRNEMRDTWCSRSDAGDGSGSSGPGCAADRPRPSLAAPKRASADGGYTDGRSSDSRALRWDGWIPPFPYWPSLPRSFRPSAHVDGCRSRSPLRGSPGFPPGSLLSCGPCGQQTFGEWRLPRRLGLLRRQLRPNNSNEVGITNRASADR